jgi:hypothetical protein
MHWRIFKVLNFHRECILKFHLEGRFSPSFAVRHKLLLIFSDFTDFKHSPVIQFFKLNVQNFLLLALLLTRFLIDIQSVKLITHAKHFGHSSFGSVVQCKVCLHLHDRIDHINVARLYL